MSSVNERESARGLYWARRLVALGVVVVACWFPARASAFPAYQLVWTRSINSGQGLAISPNGLVVGGGLLAGGLFNDPFQWKQGSSATAFDPFGHPNGYDVGTATAINAPGDIAGYDSLLPNSPPGPDITKGWVIAAGVAHHLGAGLQPDSINQTAVVVGNKTSAGGKVTAGFYSLAGATPVIVGRRIYAVNDHDTFIGTDTNGVGTSWVIGPGGLTSRTIVLPPNAVRVVPEAIEPANNLLVGEAYKANGGKIGSFQYQIPDASSTYLAIGPTGTPVAINDSRVVLYTDPATSGGAGLLDNLTGFQASLTSMLDGPLPVQWSNLVFSGMNDQGQIVGTGTHRTAGVSTSLPFVLEPNPVEFPQPPVVLLQPGLVTPNGPGSSDVPLQTSWTEQAPDNDPITNNQAQITSDGGTTWIPLNPPATATANTINTKGTVGGTVQVEANSTDSLNLTSPWATSPQYALGITDDASLAVSYKGAWTHEADADAYDGDSSKTDSVGDSASLQWSGGELGLVATTGPGEGTADVYLDGNLAETINLASATRAEQVIPDDFLFASGPHTVKVVANGDGPVVLDGFVTLGPPPVYTAAFGAPTLTPSLTVNLDASASTTTGPPITDYRWTFGDGTHQTTTTPTVAHTYADAGLDQVCLTVTGDGPPNTICHEINTDPAAHPDSAAGYLQDLPEAPVTKFTATVTVPTNDCETPSTGWPDGTYTGIGINNGGDSYAYALIYANCEQTLTQENVATVDIAGVVTNLPGSIQPGDQITVRIRASATTQTSVTVADQTQGWTTTTTGVAFDPVGGDASTATIVTGPTDPRFDPPIRFQDIEVDGVPMGANPTFRRNVANSQGVVGLATSPLNAAGTGYTLTWYDIAPDTP